MAEFGIGPGQQIALETLAEQPPITPAAAWFWKAFGHLAADRQSSMAVGHIPFTAMKAYADEYELKGHEREAFFQIIREVDAAFVKMVADKRKAAEKEPK